MDAQPKIIKTYYTISLNLITKGDFETDASKNMFFNMGMLDVPVKNSKSNIIYVTFFQASIISSACCLLLGFKNRCLIIPFSSSKNVVRCRPI